VAPTAEAKAPEPSAAAPEQATEPEPESTSLPSAIELNASAPGSEAGAHLAEWVAKAEDGSFPVVRVIKRGQTLFRLTEQVYGHANPRLVEWVKKNNPWISDITRIPAGSEIVFPKEPEEGQVKVQVKVKEIKKNTPQPQP